MKDEINPTRRYQRMFLIIVNGFEESEVIGVLMDKEKAFKIGDMETETPKFSTGARHWVTIEEWEINGKCLTIYSKINKKWSSKSLNNLDYKNSYFLPSL